MGKKARLIHVRQIGPNSERDISGVCSGCGATLLARLEAKEPADAKVLRARLQRLHDLHAAEHHPS